MQKIMIVINGPAYGSDETFNAIRLANALVRREDASVQIFLMGDAVGCAVAGQHTPDGYYALDRMLRTFARYGGSIACCGTCLDARGFTKDHLITEAERSTIDELATWTVEADKALTF